MKKKNMYIHTIENTIQDCRAWNYRHLWHQISETCCVLIFECGFEQCTKMYVLEKNCTRKL